MADRFDLGVLDTCTLIDLADIPAMALPDHPTITAVTMAELHQGIPTARDGAERAARLELLRAATATFAPLPFDAAAAARYGTMVALSLEAGRKPRPRRLDLMIAAIASIYGLPLFTRNPADFRGLESTLHVVAV